MGKGNNNYEIGRIIGSRKTENNPTIHREG